MLRLESAYHRKANEIFYIGEDLQILNPTELVSNMQICS